MPPKKRRQKVGAVNYQKRKAISGVRADEDGLGRRDVVVEGGELGVERQWSRVRLELVSISIMCGNFQLFPARFVLVVREKI